ncbi:12697_t:CDS:2, partial [Gigaspora rosea]
MGSQEAVDAYCNKTDNEEERTPPVSKRHRNVDLSDDNTSDITTGNSTSSLAKTDSSKKKSTNSIDNFIVRNITAKEKPKFEQLLLRMTVSNGWSFQWTSNPATLEFYEFLNPNLILPLTLVFDRWKNILKQHIFGSLLILSTRESLVWKTIDISSERERMIEIIPKIESMINETSIIGAKLSAVVSDSASAYSAQYEEEKQARERRHSQQIDNLRTFQNQETPLKLVPQKLVLNKHGRSHSAP